MYVCAGALRYEKSPLFFVKRESERETGNRKSTDSRLYWISQDEPSEWAKTHETLTMSWKFSVCSEGFLELITETMVPALGTLGSVLLRSVPFSSVRFNYTKVE